MENVEIQVDEDKSSPDGATPPSSSNPTATLSVPQDVNQNATLVLMPSCPEDTKF